MGYFKQNELILQLQSYLLQLEQELNNENLIEQLDAVPFAVVLSKPQEVDIEKINEIYEQLTGYSIQEINANKNYLEEIVHPVSLQNVKKFLPQFYLHQNEKKTMYFVQYAKLERGEDYSPLITFTKTPDPKSKSVIRLSLRLSDFGNLSRDLKRIVKIDQFKLKKFNQFQQLSDRELEILKLLANGMNNPKIAERLYLARQTVETHRKNINKKLEIRSFRDLMKYAMAFNLIEF